MAQIRVATVADAEAIAAVHVHTWQVAYRGLMPDAVLDSIDPAVRAARWRSILAGPGAGQSVFVAADAHADAVTGFASAGPYRAGAEPDAYAPGGDGNGEVYAIYVEPRWWGTGTGRALMDAAVAHLRRAGLTPVRLWTLDGDTRARRFYRRYGYVADGATGTHALGDGEVPTIRYTLNGP